VHLLDVRRDPGLVGGALQERGLDVRSLNPLLDVVDEEVRHCVLVAEHEVGRQVVVRVDARAGHDLEAGLLGHPAREPHIPAAEHRRRLADGLDASFDRRARGLDRRLVSAVVVDGDRWL